MKTFAVVLSMLLLATSSSAENGKKVWNFDTDKTGVVAQGFLNEAGEWKVETDKTAPSPPHVLTQLAKSSGSTYNLILVSNTNYQDVDISVMMKALAGKMDQGGGVVWRAKDAKNYYIARYNPLEENYRVYIVEKGQRTQLQSADIKYTEGWHRLRVTMSGHQIQCYYDGQKYLEAEDSTFKEAGKIGLWTKADAQTLFDDLTVSGK